MKKIYLSFLSLIIFSLFTTQLVHGMIGNNQNLSSSQEENIPAYFLKYTMQSSSKTDSEKKDVILKKAQILFNQQFFDYNAIYDFLTVVIPFITRTKDYQLIETLLKKSNNQQLFVMTLKEYFKENLKKNILTVEDYINISDKLGSNVNGLILNAILEKNNFLLNDILQHLVNKYDYSQKDIISYVDSIIRENPWIFSDDEQLIRGIIEDLNY